MEAGTGQRVSRARGYALRVAASRGDADGSSERCPGRMLLRALHQGCGNAGRELAHPVLPFSEPLGLRHGPFDFVSDQFVSSLRCPRDNSWQPMSRRPPVFSHV